MALLDGLLFATLCDDAATIHTATGGDGTWAKRTLESLVDPSVGDDEGESYLEFTGSADALAWDDIDTLFNVGTGDFTLYIDFLVPAPLGASGTTIVDVHDGSGAGGI